MKSALTKKRIIVILCLFVFFLAALTATFCIAFADGQGEKTPAVSEKNLNTWSIGSGQSEVYYGEKTKEYRVSPFSTTDTSTESTTISGLHVSLAPNDTFTYNQIIDLNKLGGVTPIFNIGVMPDDGERDVRFIYFTLTDAYDPSNVMTVQISTGITDPSTLSAPNSWTIFSYLMAKTNNQTFAGTADDAPTFGTNGHIYGTISKFGLYGGRSEYKMGNEYLALFYESDEKALYVQSLAGKQLVCDFDDTDYFTVPFDGFTTGEVILSMYATSYYTDSFDMYFREIAGETVFEETIISYAAPRIVTDAPENVLEGLVGYEYPVFAASAEDPYGSKTTLTTQVYFGYGSELCYNVNIRNGAFTPQYEGIYTIVYTAENEYGAAASYCIPVTVMAGDYNALSIGQAENAEAAVGEKVTIATPVISGGVGETDYTVTVTLNGGEISVENDTFVPTEKGEYLVSYIVEDYFGRTAEMQYTITVTLSDVPVIDEEMITLPKYFIKGQTYTLPQVRAYDYADGGKERSTLVDAAGGTLDGMQFTPTAEEAVISYIAVKGEKSSYVSRTIPVVDVSDGNGGIDLAKYFYSENISAVKSAASIVFSNTESGTDASAEFINPFVAKDFSFTAGVPSSSAAGAKIVLSLTDSVRRGEQIALVMERTSGGVSISYDGSTIGEYNSGSSLRFYYNASKNTITINSQDSIELTGFSGFSSGYLYFSFSLLAGQKTELSLSMLYGQGINNLTVDIGEPVIVSAQDYVHDWTHGGQVTVFKANYADAIDPVISATVTVYTPSGEIAADIDGNALDGVSADAEYVCELNEYGYWYVEYTAHSENGDGSVRYPLLVVDDVAPTVELEGELPSSVSAGASVTLPAATISDNVDTADTMTCLCLVQEMKSHKTEVYAPGTQVTFETQGTYRVTYLVSDSVGNVTKLIYEIIVG